MRISSINQSPYKRKNSYLINKNLIVTSPNFCGGDLKEALKGLCFGTILTVPLSCAHICMWKMDAIAKKNQNQIEDIVPGDSIIKQSSNIYQPEISDFDEEDINNNSAGYENKNFITTRSTIQSNELDNNKSDIVQNDTTKLALQNLIIKEETDRLNFSEKVLIDKDKIYNDKLEIINKKLKNLDLKQEELDSLKNILKEQINTTNDSVQYLKEINNFFNKHSGDDNKIDIDEFVTMLENIQTTLKEHNIQADAMPSINTNSLKEDDSEIDLTQLKKETNTKNVERNQWYHNREYYNNGISKNDIIEVPNQEKINTNISSKNRQYQNSVYSNNSSISKAHQKENRVEQKDTAQNKKNFKEKSFKEIFWHTWFINNFIIRSKK